MILADRKPCAHCGGPKGEGRGRRLCDACISGGTVFCPACRTLKDKGDFYSSQSRRTGRSGYCKACTTDRNRDSRYRMPYGTLRRMYERQGGRCASCGDETPLDLIHVDHDHSCCPDKGRSCGRCIRELLCPGCNLALGLLKDDADRALALAAYLLTHQGGESDHSR